ncbi:MAG: winged helix DNA-binding domain-containing protein, partial [Anaerolineales bacterium]|nr:winged helix DNA-binding domain-containing protein [Anaerolineales bacterium]
MIRLTEAQIRWYRLRRSGLVEPFDGVLTEAVTTAVSTLAGIQAQILPAAAISLWNRTTGLTYARFEEMLFTERSLVKLWGQRQTLHLYTSREWALIHAAMPLE